MSTWPKALSMGVHLTKGQCDQSLPKCQPDPKPDPGGMSDQRSAWLEDLTKMSTWPKASSMGWASIWLSAKRTSENLNTLCILGLASQMSFLWKTNTDNHLSDIPCIKVLMYWLFPSFYILFPGTLSFLIYVIFPLFVFPLVSLPSS